MVNYNPEDYELITTIWYVALNKDDEYNSNNLDYQIVKNENGSANCHVLFK